MLNVITRPRWTRVSDRLPEDGQRCLVYAPFDRVGRNPSITVQATWSRVAGWWPIEGKRVTHWMPAEGVLPPPPEDLVPTA